MQEANIAAANDVAENVIEKKTDRAELEDMLADAKDKTAKIKRHYRKQLREYVEGIAKRNLTAAGVKMAMDNLFAAGTERPTIAEGMKVAVRLSKAADLINEISKGRSVTSIPEICEGLVNLDFANDISNGDRFEMAYQLGLLDMVAAISRNAEKAIAFHHESSMEIANIEKKLGELS